jgi:lipoprotein-anchoring transpeptidase ErfK/SrfK
VGRAAILLLAAALCGGCKGKRAAPDAAPIARTGPRAGTTPPAPGEPPLFPPETRSLRLTRTIAVRLEPGSDAKQIGTIAVDTRVSWTATERGAGCSKPWVAIEPRGWVCGEYLEAQTRAPSGVELPRLAIGALVPGVYGKVTADNVMTYVLEDDKAAKARAKKPEPKGPVASPSELEDPVGAGSAAAIDAEAGRGPIMTADGKRVVPGKPLVGSVNVRKYGELSAGGKLYWKVTKSPAEYVPASVIRQHTPSTYRGVRLNDETGMTLPIGFVFPRGGGRTAWSYATAKKTGAKRQVPAREAVPILETATDPKTGKVTAYRIGVEEWMDAGTLRVVEAAAPPPQLTNPEERWLDVDADREVLVAYEGALPVYATLVSTGQKDTPTDPGVYRVQKKVMEIDMRDLKAEDPYSVANVPWTQVFFPDDGLALHTAYWHDKFGTARSHGCVNLAPSDARWLYFWTDPWVPPGWTMTAGVVEAPGSIVRVRTAAVPDPPLLGYAKRVYEEAQAAAPAP